MNRILNPRIQTRLCQTSRKYVKKQTDMDAQSDDQFHFIPMGKSDLPMQTRVSLLSKDMTNNKLVAVKAFSEIGFRLLDGEFMYGPVAVFPKTVLSWRVYTPNDITPESLELFLILQPKLDVLIIGAGNTKDVDQVRKQVGPTLTEHRIGYEIMKTEDAIPTFNFLNNETRYVAAALYPPNEVHVTSRDHGNHLRSLFDPSDLKEEFFYAAIGAIPGSGQDPLKNVCRRIWGTNSELAAQAEKEIIKLRDIRREQKRLHNEKILHKQIEERREDRKLLDKIMNEGKMIKDE